MTPPPPPPAERPIVLHGARCVLRAFHADELDALLAAREAAESFGGARERPAREREHLRRRIARSGRLHDGLLEFAIEVDGKLAGDVQGRSGRRMLPPGVWEFGVELYGPSRRGQGIGSEAVALLTQYLFTERGAGRVQATTDVANAPMRAVLAKLGFQEEGVLRGFMPDEAPDGPRHDYVLSAVTAAEWAERRDRGAPAPTRP